MTDPLDLFQRWFDEARSAGEAMPEAMALATATPEGRPSVRYVLYRGCARGGLRFFTNYESRKSEELGANPVAAVAFHWPTLTRQVRVEGGIQRLPAAESEEYFHGRPRGSQLAAWASPQSRPVSYDDLLSRYQELEQSYQGRPIPLPAYWGGFLLVPDRIELWQGREHRLHQRILYTRQGDGWSQQELAP